MLFHYIIIITLSLLYYYVLGITILVDSCFFVVCICELLLQSDMVYAVSDEVFSSLKASSDVTSDEVVVMEHAEGSLAVVTEHCMVTTHEDLSEEEVEESSEEEEEPIPCTLCGQVPCDWDSFGEEIWEECEALKAQGADNKQVRFHAYKLYTRLRHGILRRFDRRPLPVCVRGEIMDSWPDANHEYVGFHAALRDAVEED